MPAQNHRKRSRSMFRSTAVQFLFASRKETELSAILAGPSARSTSTTSRRVFRSSLASTPRTTTWLRLRPAPIPSSTDPHFSQVDEDCSAGFQTGSTEGLQALRSLFNMKLHVVALRKLAG